MENNNSTGGGMEQKPEYIGGYAEQEPECVCGCGCVGYAYVPIQQADRLYSAADGLLAGTIFPELNLTIDEYGYICRQIGGCQNVES